MHAHCPWIGSHRATPERRRQLIKDGGFTLLELIVALAVMGVASWCFVSMHNGGLKLAKAGRNQMVAASLAEEKLGELLRTPKQFLWEVPSDATSVALFPIREGQDDARVGNLFDLPTTMPTARPSYDKQVVIFDQFTWKAFGRRPSEGATYYEVTLSVFWIESGREKVLALTSSVPRYQVEN